MPERSGILRDVARSHAGGYTLTATGTWCDRCSASVLDPRVHDRWHDEYVRAVEVPLGSIIQIADPQLDDVERDAWFGVLLEGLHNAIPHDRWTLFVGGEQITVEPAQEEPNDGNTPR